MSFNHNVIDTVVVSKIQPHSDCMPDTFTAYIKVCLSRGHIQISEAGVDLFVTFRSYETSMSFLFSPLIMALIETNIKEIIFTSFHNEVSLVHHENNNKGVDW